MYMCINDCGMIPTIKGERTPVWRAAFGGHIDVVKFLVLEAKVDFNKASKV